MTHSERKSILMVSFHFAPSSEVGAKRFSILSRIFQEEYFDVHVLTVDEKYSPSRDRSIASGGEVHRTKMFPSSGDKSKMNTFSKAFFHIWVLYLAILDPFCGMIIPGLIKGLGIVRRNKIDAIMTTGPPFSPFVLAWLISLLTGRKLILDYRDPWSNIAGRYNFNWFGRTVIRRVNRILEKRVIARASTIVFVTDFMKDDFLEDFDACTGADTLTITNGLEKFEGLEPLFLEKDKKTILYAGSLVYERNIALLEKAIRALIEKGFIRRESVAIHVFSSLLNAKNREAIAAMGESITVHDPVEYGTMLRYMKGADILFLTSSAEVPYAIPFKFYDYLNMERPIFAVAPRDSAMARKMSELNCGVWVPVDDEEAIQAGLLKMLAEQDTYDFSGLHEYTWDSIAAVYAEAIAKTMSRDA